MNKIEQLIEKRENTLMNYTINSMGEMVIKEFLKDLQSLQDTTECDNCGKLIEQLEHTRARELERYTEKIKHEGNYKKSMGIVD